LFAAGVLCLIKLIFSLDYFFYKLVVVSEGVVRGAKLSIGFLYSARNAAILLVLDGVIRTFEPDLLYFAVLVVDADYFEFWLN
jgi:hypothetical protein